jgi:hypothetical protein
MLCIFCLHYITGAAPRRLERTFGISGDFGRGGQGSLKDAAHLFPADFGRTGSSGNLLSSTSHSASDRMLKSAGDLFPEREGTGGGAGGTQTTTTGAVGGGAGGGAAGHTKPRSRHSASRKGFDPLPIQSMTGDKLQSALRDAKVNKSCSTIHNTFLLFSLSMHHFVRSLSLLARYNTCFHLVF